jgi:sugar phosphate isomerase/epimerase
MDIGDPSASIKKIKAAGYDGVEIGFPAKDNHLQTELYKAARQEGLICIAQHYDAGAETLQEYLDSFARHLYSLASFNPLFINSQTGKDFFSFEENCRVFEKALAIEKDTGVPILHETHRGKALYCIDALATYTDQFPLLKITADFSHYCVVSESFLQADRQQSVIRKAMERTGHIHARVGYTQGPQVSDPQAEEWDEALQYHLGWWDEIININRHKEIFTITPEFGPPPYMPRQLHSKMPVASQWEINLFMKKLLYHRYNS